MGMLYLKTSSKKKRHHYFPFWAFFSYQKMGGDKLSQGSKYLLEKEFKGILAVGFLWKEKVVVWTAILIADMLGSRAEESGQCSIWQVPGSCSHWPGQPSALLCLAPLDKLGASCFLHLTLKFAGLSGLFSWGIPSRKQDQVLAEASMPQSKSLPRKQFSGCKWEGPLGRRERKEDYLISLNA